MRPNPPPQPLPAGPPAVAVGLWCAALATLPWIGVDLFVLASGRDLGAGLQPSWLLLAGAWLAAGPGPLRRMLPPAWRRLLLAAAGAVLLSALGLWIAPAGVGLAEALLRYLKQIAQLFIMSSFALWPVVHLRGAGQVRLSARWLVGGALVQAAYGLLQLCSYPTAPPLLAALERVFTSNPSILSGSASLYVGDRFLAVPRLRGTACEPLYLGNYLLLALPMVALTGWRLAGRAAAVTILGLLLLLTWSRGAWLGALGGLVVAAWWLAPRLRGPEAAAVRRLARRWLLGVGVLVLLLMVLAGAGFEPARLPWRRLAQTFSTHDWSNLTRLYSYQAAWRAFELSPVVGIGWGQFGWHFPALVDPAGLQAMFTWPVVANYPLLVLCETGLVGFAVLAVATAGLVRGVLRGRHRATPTPALGVLAAAGAAIAVQTLTFSQYNLPHAWVALGLLAAVLRSERGEVLS